MSYEIFESQYSAEQMENSYTNGVPRINPTNKHWERWSITTQTWVDTGIIAEAQTTGAIWGQIQGTLADQTDLNTAIQSKASTSYVDAELLKKAPLWNSATTYSAGAYCVHNGFLWKNTSGASSTNVEPSTNYNVWNVTYSNVNLIDNPWFTVNQRGESSYVTSGDIGSAMYTLDRWLMFNVTKVDIANNIVTITSNTQVATYYARFGQALEPSLRDAINGKQVTASVLKSDNTIVSATFTFDKTANDYTILSIGNWNLKYMWESTLFFETYQHPLDTISIKAVKLELGSVSTLANDVAPNYAEELAKCKYYYRKINDRIFGSCYTNGTSLSFYLQDKMRVSPSVNITALDVIGSGFQTIINSAVSTNGKNGITFYVTTSSNFIGREVYESTVVGELSADL